MANLRRTLIVMSVVGFTFVGSGCVRNSSDDMFLAVFGLETDSQDVQDVVTGHLDALYAAKSGQFEKFYDNPESQTMITLAAEFRYQSAIRIAKEAGMNVGNHPKQQ